MANYIMIVADTNDGDYITSFKPINDEDLKILKPLIEKIKVCTEDHNFPTDEQIDYDNDELDLDQLYVSSENEEQDKKALELFQSRYAPVSEYGFHTIEKIELYDVGHVEKLL